MNKGLGNKILALRQKGASYSEIQKKLKCSRGTISYHCRKLGLGNVEGQSVEVVRKSTSKARYKINRCRNCGKEIRAGRKYCGVECWVAHTKQKTWDRYEKDLSKLKKISSQKVREYFASKGIVTCQDCGQGEDWHGNKLILHVHHIDGNRKNNNIENLILLCPNCHAVRHNKG